MTLVCVLTAEQPMTRSYISMPASAIASEAHVTAAANAANIQNVRTLNDIK